MENTRGNEHHDPIKQRQQRFDIYKNLYKREQEAQKREASTEPPTPLRDFSHRSRFEVLLEEKFARPIEVVSNLLHSDQTKHLRTEQQERKTRAVGSFDKRSATLEKVHDLFKTYHDSRKVLSQSSLVPKSSDDLSTKQLQDLQDSTNTFLKELKKLNDNAQFRKDAKEDIKKFPNGQLRRLKRAQKRMEKAKKKSEEDSRAKFGEGAKGALKSMEAFLKRADNLVPVLNTLVKDLAESLDITDEKLSLTNLQEQLREVSANIGTSIEKRSKEVEDFLSNLNEISESLSNTCGENREILEQVFSQKFMKDFETLCKKLDERYYSNKDLHTITLEFVPKKASEDIKKILEIQEQIEMYLKQKVEFDQKLTTIEKLGPSFQRFESIEEDFEKYKTEFHQHTTDSSSLDAFVAWSELTKKAIQDWSDRIGSIKDETSDFNQYYQELIKIKDSVKIDTSVSILDLENEIGKLQGFISSSEKIKDFREKFTQFESQIESHKKIFAAETPICIISQEDLTFKAKRAKELGVNPLSIDKYMSKYLPLKWISPKERASASHVLWAVTQAGELFIAPKKKILKPSVEEISHAVMSQKEPLQAVGEAKVVGDYHQYVLVDISNNSDCYQTKDHYCLDIGKDAFRHANVPLLKDAIEELAAQQAAKSGDQEAQTKQTSPDFSEILEASAEIKDLWTTLNDKKSDSSFEDTDKLKNKDYTLEIKKRVNTTVKLAERLSSHTNNIGKLFKAPILPYKNDELFYNAELECFYHAAERYKKENKEQFKPYVDNGVIYDPRLNRLLIPTGVEPLKVVLSTIREMDHAWYQWAGAQDGPHKSAQDAATAIRLIEACRNLDQSMPEDMPSLGELKLHVLAEEYHRAYTNGKDTKQSQDAARQCIYDKYAQQYRSETSGSLLDSLGPPPPQVDASNYGFDHRDYQEGVELVPSREEMRWKLFRNLQSDNLAYEVSLAELADVKPARFGDAHFDETIKGRVIWVMSVSGELFVAPRDTLFDPMSHGMLAGGRPISAGGEANIYKRGEDDYILLDINLFSGHYLPRCKLDYALAHLHRLGIRVPSLNESLE